VTVIDEVEEYTSPLVSSIIPLSDNETTVRIPSFAGTSDNSRSPTNCNIMKVLYQLETTQGSWEEATISLGGGTSSVSWEATALSSLTIGFHSLYVVALDSTSGTINMTENFTGGITPYYFLVRTPETGIDIDTEKPTGLMFSKSNHKAFSSSTQISYYLPAIENPGGFTLKVYNISGSVVKTLADKVYTPGLYTEEWNGTNEKGEALPSGIYFYNLEAENLKAATQKTILIR